MKPFLLIALTFIIQIGTCVSAQSQSINDNVLTINPLSPSLEDNDVMVTFDAARGNGSLAGSREDVYIHTGVLTNQSKSPSDWKYIQTQWGTADMRWKMTSMGNDRYTFRIGNIRQFYHLPAGEIVKQLAFVFRNANGSMIGKNANNSDIFINVTNRTPIQAQNGTIVTLNSTMPTLDDPNIVVTFDANIGNRQLLGTQDVYIHTGVLTAQSKSPSDWKYIQTQWGTADMRWKMEPIGNNRYTFKIGNIRQFYKIPNGETVLQLAFVFRNANASLIGKNANQSDVFIPINGQNTNNNTVNNSSSSNNVVINNNTVNNSSSSNNVIINNNNSSARSNSTVNNSSSSNSPNNGTSNSPNNGNGRFNNSNQTPSTGNSITNAPSVNIYEYTKPSDMLGMVVQVQNEYLMFLGEKKEDGILNNILHLLWVNNKTKEWVSMDLNESYLPTHVNYSNGTQVNITNINGNSFDAETILPNGQVRRDRKNTNRNLNNAANDLRNSIKSISMTNCKTAELVPVSCKDNKLSMTITAGLFMWSSVSCGLGIGEIIISGGTSTLLLGMATYANCSDMIQNGMELYRKEFNCDKPAKYSKGRKLENYAKQSFLTWGTLLSDIKTSKPSFVMAAIQCIASFMADHFDKTPITTNQIPDCTPQQSEPFTDAVLFQTHKADATYIYDNDKEAKILYLAYSKSSHELDVDFVFYSFEGSSSPNFKLKEKKTITKHFTAQQREGVVKFGVKHTGKNCAGPMYGDGTTDNGTSEWMKVRIRYNGKPKVPFFCSPPELHVVGDSKPTSKECCTFEIWEIK
jgi:hypothetical protein